MDLPVRTFPKSPASQYDQDLRSQIRDGDLLMCSGKYGTSKLIKFATKSCWSHVALIMRLPEFDRIMVFESVESKGVRTIPLSQYLTNYNQKGTPYSGGIIIARHMGFTTYQNPRALKKLVGKAINLLGYPYSKLEVIRIATRILMSNAGISKNYLDKLRGDREYICSEYVDECFQNIHLNIARKGDYITPADFARDQRIALKWVLQSS